MARDYSALARKRAEQMTQSIWYKLEAGPRGLPKVNTIRVLDTPEGDGTQGKWFEYMIHREVGPKKRMVRCGKDALTEEGYCWLCDVLIPKLKRMGKKTRAAKLAPQSTFLVQVAKVDTDNDPPEFSGPYLWTPSKGLARKVLQRVIGGKRNALDPKHGRNITVEREGSGKFDTEYGPIEFDPDPSKVPSRIMKKLKPFSELQEIPVYKESLQKAAYQGRDVDPDDEDDLDERKTMKKKAKKGRSVEDDEEDLDEALDEDEDDDDEDDDKPAKKKKKVTATKSRKTDDDDEDDDDADAADDDEDDEDEAPAKKKKKSKKDDEDDDEAEEEEDDDGDDDDDDDDKPAKKKKAVVKKKKKHVEEEDEEEEEEEDDAEEDDDEDDDPPAKKKAVKKGAKKKSSKDDDDDEDDADEAEDSEDEEEEDDDEPKKKKVSPPPPSVKKKAKKKKS